MTLPFLIVHALGQSADADHQQHGFIRRWSLSPENTGFRALRMCAGVIPPGTATKPHWHASCETAIYVIQGRVEIHIGKGLEEIYYAGPGDFIYVPKGVIHQTITLDEPCHYIQVVDSAEEGTVEYDPLRDGQPTNAVDGAASTAAVTTRVADRSPSE
jgi:uncharacterized RmlC-like cupin family protein